MSPQIVRNTFALCSIGLSFCVSQCFADSAKGQAAFQTVLNKIDTAEKHRNLAEWSRLLKANSMPYFTLKLPGHDPLDINEAIDEERNFLNTMQSIDVNSEHITSFIVSDNHAAVTTSANQIAKILDSDGELGKPGLVHKMNVVTEIAYSLEWSDGIWKIQSVNETTKSVAVDGHTAPLPQPPDSGTQASTTI